MLIWYAWSCNCQILYNTFDPEGGYLQFPPPGSIYSFGVIISNHLVVMKKRLPSHQQPWPMSVTNALPRIIPEDDPEQMNAASHGKLSFYQEELTNSKVAVVNRESPSQIQSAAYKRTRNQYCIIGPSVISWKTSGFTLSDEFRGTPEIQRQSQPSHVDVRNASSKITVLGVPKKCHQGWSPSALTPWCWKAMAS